MCMTKKKRKYAYGGDEEYRSSYPQMEKGRHSLYSPMQGPLLEGDRTRYTDEVPHDWTNVRGWNLKGKQRGC